MNITFDLISAINLIGVFHGILIAFIMLLRLTRKETKAENLFFGMMMLVGAITTSYGVLIPTSLFKYAPKLLLFIVPFKFFIGPILYFYTIALFGEKLPGKKIILVHLVPGLVLFLLFLHYTILFNDESIVKIAANFFDQKQQFFQIRLIWFLYLTQLPVYMYFSIKAGYKHKNNPETGRGFRWKWFLFILSIHMFLWAGLSIVSVLYYLDVFEFQLYRIIPFSASFGLIVITYRILLYGHYLPLKPDRDTQTADKEKYSGSRIPDSKARHIQNELTGLIEHEKYYRDPDIDLNDIAKELGVNKVQLSQVLNQYMNTSFNDFINKYRTDEVKNKMMSAEYEDFTILEIALQSGFNSKSTFNDVFKKYTGMTPSEYRKKFRSPADA